MFVYVAAKEGKIELTVEKEEIGAASSAAELALMFAANNITFGHSIFCASSIDFCEEEGFEAGRAEMLVTEAIEMVEV